MGTEHWGASWWDRIIGWSRCGDFWNIHPPVHYSFHQWDPGVFYISVSTPKKGLLAFPALILAQFTAIICLDDIRMETGKVPAAQSPWLLLAVRVQDPCMLHQGGKWPAEGLPACIDRKCKTGWRGCWEDQGHPLMSLGSLSPRKGPFILLADHHKLSLMPRAIDNFIFVHLWIPWQGRKKMLQWEKRSQICIVRYRPLTVC